MSALALRPHPELSVVPDADGRVPPHDLDAEASVLSAIMLDSEGAMTLARVRDFLAGEHFYSEAHRRIYEAACEVVDAGGKPDMVQIGSRLKSTNRLGQIGGMAYLADILDAAPVVVHVENYATTVFDTWRTRQVIAIAQMVSAEGYFSVPSAQAYVDGAIERLAAVSRRSLGSPIERNLDAIKRILRDLQERMLQRGERLYGMPTGIRALDRITGGLHSGHLFTLVAGPGAGKTTLAMQIAVNVARQRLGVLVFSTEQDRTELLEKMLSHIGRVHGDHFRDLQFSPADWNRMTVAAQEIAHLPVWIDDTRELDARTLRARAVQRHEQALAVDKVPLGLVVIDYVQNLSPGEHQERSKKHEVVADAAKTAKTLARQLKIPVMLLAQRKRVDGDGPKTKSVRPKQTDIADSSQVEKESDEVLFIWQRDGQGEKERTLTLAKQRGGALGGDISMRMEGEYSTLVDAEGEAVRDYVDRGIDE